MITQNVWQRGSQHAVDAVDEPVGDSAEGLLVMMPLAGHHSPVNLGQIGIDLAGGVGGENEGAFDAIVAALGGFLPWSFGTAAV